MSRRNRIACGIRKAVLPPSVGEAVDPSISSQIQADPSGNFSSYQFQTPSGRPFDMTFARKWLPEQDEEHAMTNPKLAQIIQSLPEGDVPVVEIDFVDDTGSMEVTGKGENWAVLRQAYQAVATAIQSFSDVAIIIFNANNANSAGRGNARRGIYDRVAAQIGGRDGYVHYDWGPMGRFIILNPYYQVPTG